MSDDRYNELVAQGQFIVACATISERYAALVVATAHREGNADVPAAMTLQLGVTGMLKRMQEHYHVDVDTLADMEDLDMVQSINSALDHMRPDARFAPGFTVSWVSPRIAGVETSP